MLHRDIPSFNLRFDRRWHSPSKTTKDRHAERPEVHMHIEIHIGGNKVFNSKEY